MATRLAFDATNVPRSSLKPNENFAQSVLNKGLYDNPWDTWRRPSVWSALKWQVGRKEPSVPADIDALLPIVTPDWKKINKPDQDVIQLTWIGHSSFLVQMEGFNFLTDPVWSERCSPTQLVGPKRYRPTPMKISELPPIDFVVISHNHYDHLDIAAVEGLGDKTIWIVPKGHREWFKKCGVTKVFEFDWWDQMELVEGLNLVCLPCQHWSKRTAFDDMCALWSGWAIMGKKYKIYFAGDTGYCTSFKEIGQKFGPFDLGLIPIGAYEPRDFMCPQHINPEEAVKIHQDIGATKSVGMHWGTFILTDEPILEPPQKVKAAMKDAGLNEDDFLAVKHGELQIFSKEEKQTQPQKKEKKKEKPDDE